VAGDIVARRKNGKLVCWYVMIDGRRVALRTKDAVEARRRARLAREGKWPPPEEEAARVTDGAFSFVGHPAPVSSGTPPSPQPAPEPAGDWTAAAAGASADAAPPINPEVMPPGESAEEKRAKVEAAAAKLADLAVTAQIELTSILVRWKVYAGFRTPPLPDEGRAALAHEYKTMIDYGGAAIQLPPWVTGLVIPGLTLLGSAVAIGKGYGEIARKQKREDNAPSQYGGVSAEAA
jgi:hypothetical protein